MMKNPIKVLIITCWVLLLVCCIIKIFCKDLFIAGTDNVNFINLCNYINQTKWLNFAVRYNINYMSCSIYYMAVLRESRPTLNSLKWMIPLAIYITIKLLFYHTVVFFILDIVMMVGLPILIEHNKKVIIFAIVGFGLNTLFQLISMWLKLNNYKMFDDNLLVGIILSIDYYIMLTLYMLYSIKYFKKER